MNGFFVSGNFILMCRTVHLLVARLQKFFVSKGQQTVNLFSGIQPCSEKDPNAIKFSNEESKQTYAISIKVPAIQVEFRRMLPFEDDNGGKLSYTLNGTLYPDEQVVIYDIGDVKPETEKKRRGRRKKSEIEAEQKEN